MEKEYFYIYCKGILGVKTNMRDFKWVYGSVAPSVSKEEYKNCLIKFDVCRKAEKQLTPCASYNKKFQAYSWNDENKTLYYRRKLPLRWEIGYNLSIDDNLVVVEIGKNYHTFVKNRTMNLHGMYYLLSDVANMLLLKNGLLTLYASAVYYEPLKKGIVNFAAPHTGKTFTATALCETDAYSLVGEDVVISDGRQVYSCPWTCSYRKTNNGADKDASLGRDKRAFSGVMKENCMVTDLFVLSLGDRRSETNPDVIGRPLSILNGYLFQYYSSPIAKILGYFDESYDKNWGVCADEMLEKMVKQSECRWLQSEKSADFPAILHKMIVGETI